MNFTEAYFAATKNPAVIDEIFYEYHRSLKSIVLKLAHEKDPLSFPIGCDPDFTSYDRVFRVTNYEDCASLEFSPEQVEEYIETVLKPLDEQ